MIARRPAHADVPVSVATLLAGRPYEVVWRNELGGLTFEVDAGAEFIKWMPADSGIDFTAEIERLSWAATWIRVPHVLSSGQAVDGAWMVTAGLPGHSAVSERWLAEPRTAVTAIGTGLRAFHDALPVAHCPFSWSAGERAADARRRACCGLIDPDEWHVDHPGTTLTAALDRVDQSPPVDRLVVCHGDSCAPNTLIGGDGRWSGHVDLEMLGVADRWADLAVATLSTQWNYGPGWEDCLLAAYGVDPDPDRTAYYRLLWDLGP